jgi:hypothetical protein
MPQVYAATPADVRDAARTIVKAFIRDPFNAYFYNYIPDQSNPPWGTEEMMALNIRNNLLTDIVLVVDDGNRKCAGVALWTPPRFEPLGWIEWCAKLIYSAYGGLMGYFYYRNRGINRAVCLFLIKLTGRDFVSSEKHKRKSWSAFLARGM